MIEVAYIAIMTLAFVIVMQILIHWQDANDEKRDALKRNTETNQNN